MPGNEKSGASEMQGDPERFGAKKRLGEVGISLPAPPEPFGTYAEVVQAGNLLMNRGSYHIASLASSAEKIFKVCSQAKQ